MDINFYKIQFAKNDLLAVNFLHTPGPDNEQKGLLSRLMCRRHTGVGGNGLLFLLPSEREELRIELFRPSGRAETLLFDALLCAGRFAFDFGLVKNNKISIETESGVYSLSIIDSNHFQINIGKPFFINSGKELKEQPDEDYNSVLTIDNKRCMITPIQLTGKNFGIHFPGELNQEYLKHLSSSICQITKDIGEYRPVFTRIISREEQWAYLWHPAEQVDFCSSVGAAFVASVINGFAEREGFVRINREELYLQWNSFNNTIFITGTPKYVFTGTFYADLET